ncbi:MAG TPA: HlyD family efflux transporter periplasmic adaptor subunit [Bacteroidales bacterium]|nr:HlyD family efflux transporter periplasmic adaptor subunit [Bacteroidales bacterium]
MKLNKNLTTVIITGILLFTSTCGNNKEKADAYGNFESDEIIVSAQNTGDLVVFDVEEGMQLKEDELVGIIDTTSLVLQKEQILAQKKVIAARYENIRSQLEVQAEQLKNLEREKSRLEKLFQQGAATEQQYEDMKGKADVALMQLLSIKTQFKSVDAEGQVLESQLNLIQNQISKCKIINPVKGIVLEKYINNHELVVVGKSLYKIANLENMELLVYVSGSQLSGLKIGDSVAVYIDKSRNDLMEFPAVISWISSEVEFTPKIIQTREERVNMVYGVKLLVKNDGTIKIGMPGEVRFN